MKLTQHQWAVLFCYAVNVAGLSARGPSSKCFRKLKTELGKDSYGLVNIVLRKNTVGITDSVGGSAGRSAVMLTNYSGHTRINSNHFAETIANSVRNSFIQNAVKIVSELKKSSRAMSVSTLNWLCDSVDHCCFNS